MALAVVASQVLPVQNICAALAVPRSTFYYDPKLLRKLGKPPQNALSFDERQAALLLANSERFCNDTPRAIVARLADEDQVYLCSPSSLYRILRADNLVRERRAQRKHPHYAKPVLMADAINQVWSWDIAKMRGPFKHLFYNAYVAIDFYSRFIPGWMVADHESGDLARQFVNQTCAAWGIGPDTLTLHADNGGPMKSLPLYYLLENLSVAKSHSRPHTSNDNPFSESLFKTTKYHPTYPDHFDDIEHARKWMQEFVNWYNNIHHHSALAMMTPADVYFGRTKIRQNARQMLMNDAYQRNPERFTHGVSIARQPPAQVWLNPPAKEVIKLPNSIP